MSKYRLSRGARVALAAVGVILILAALVALGYALWPAEMLSLHSTLAPALLTPPAGVSP
jgi:hypothetical protein